MFKSTLNALGSLMLTLPAMGVLVLAVLVSYNEPDAHIAWLVVPLTLLAFNLLAAILANPRFRRQGGLLVFHLGLLLVIVLVALGRLTFLEGRFEIAEDQSFDPDLVEVERRGPWHPWTLDEISFVQAEIEVDYAPGLRRGHTRSTVRVATVTGMPELVTLGDDTPLIAGSYRFYTTSNKGFAVVLTWLGGDGTSRTGAIHLPSYPLLDWKQVNTWISPEGQEIEVDMILPDARPEHSTWTLNSAEIENVALAVRFDNQSTVLSTGERVSVSGGRLRFDDVRMWMGYRITYDPTLPWLFAAALVAVLGLGWHFWGNLWSRPLPVEYGGIENVARGDVEASSIARG